jgi:rare lipoprotein A
MKIMGCLLICLGLLPGVHTLAQERPKGEAAAQHTARKIQYGTASFYSNKFQGRPTASGELYDKDKMTCAHNALPMDTWVKVTNLRNKRSVVVRVTDRLHHKNKRLVDLSRAAAARLGYVKRGLARVKVEILPGPPAATQP